jgi:glucosylceramidase
MPRARRIDSTANSQILNVASQNPDGSLVLVAGNDTSATGAFKLVWQGRWFAYSLPVNTSVTFRWKRHER